MRLIFGRKSLQNAAQLHTEINAIANRGKLRKRWNWPRLPGWTGSTFEGCWGGSGMTDPPKPKRFTVNTAPCCLSQQSDSHQAASEIPKVLQ